MGHINPKALYSNLLLDVSSRLPNYVIAGLVAGENVDAWPDITAEEFQCLALAKSFYKKFVDTTEAEADKRALDKFLAANERCRTWQLQLTTSWDEVLWGELRRSLYDFWNPCGLPLISSFEEILDNGRCGPGVSIGSDGNDFYTKMFSSELSTTADVLYRAYTDYVSRYPDWANAEKLRQASYGDSRVVAGNRLSFVPKTSSIARCICIEPVLNMFYQLGVGAILESRLKRFFGISLSDQPGNNRALARQGSIDGSFSTLDLESASDSIALPMLQQLLPQDMYNMLVRLRSPVCKLPDGSLVELSMVSTMGNGYTFPLQTMLFTCALTAAARARGFALGRPRADGYGTYGVFGDDIIVPTGCHYFSIEGRKLFENYSDTLVRDVVRLLDIMGFVVNRSKSFFEGPFRESCGADYFNGLPCRGVYIKTLRTLESRFVAVNLLNRWSALTGIPLNRCVRSLLDGLPYQPVPVWESDDAGVKVPFSEVRGLRLHKGLQSVLYRKQVPRARQLRIEEDGTSTDGRKPNPFGLMISLLRGDIRNGRVSIRSGATLYRRCYAVAPSWDETPRELGYSGRLPSRDGWLRWKTAVATNMMR